MPSKVSPDDHWRPLAKALGDSIKKRRKALLRLPEQITSEVDLSASYYRSIEAGSTVPPPSIAIPLAKALDWDPARMSELLCVIAYLRPPKGESATARRLWLANKGLIPSVLAVSGREELTAALSEYFGSAGLLHVPRSTDVSGSSQKHPWMVGLAVRRMISDLSSIPFKVDLAYMVEFEDRHTDNITEAVAILSYTPTGISWLNSHFKFQFMQNSFEPKFTVVFPEGERKPRIVAGELVDALISRFEKTAKNKIKLRETLTTNLVAQTRPVSSGGTQSQFRFDLINNSLLEPGESASPNVQAFHNAWLYKLGAEGTWIGFVDNYDPNEPDRHPVLAPLAIEDAERLAANL